MSTVLLTSLDFNKLESFNFRFQNLAADPGSPVGGQAYWNSSTKKLRVYDGTSSWVEMGTGGGTFTSATLTQPAAGFTVSNSGVAQTSTGSWTFTLANDLAALEGLSTTGVAVRTAADAWTTRTITGTTNQVTVTNGDGVSGNPTLSLPQNIHTAATPTFASVTISNAPSAASDAVRKDYVDNLINGMQWKQPVKYVAASNLSLTGAATPDGTAVVTGDRVLCIAQSTAGQNGPWVANTAGTWTRPTDFDAWAEVPGAVFQVTNGTTYADTQWIATANSGGTMGTTDPAFVQMPTPLATVAGAGLVKNGSTLDVQVDGTTLEINSDTLRIKNAGVDLTTKVTGNLPVGNGGTGSNTAAGAKTNLGFMTRYAQDIGDGAATSIAVTHNLGTLDVIVKVFRKSDGAEVWCDVTMTNVNTVTLGFSTAPTAAQYRVVVVG